MKIEKYNEFVNEGQIYNLIEKAESTPSSDLVVISKRDPNLYGKKNLIQISLHFRK